MRFLESKMIISENTEEPIKEFESLLEKAHNLITSEAQNNPNNFLKMDSNDFEKTVSNALEEKAKGTPFNGTIKLIGGHSFPDIIVKKFYGVEVKTVRKNHWKSAGNSIFETTRDKFVENIFIYFAKLCGNIPEFKYRPYQECLYDVAITHSPRYMIDMELKRGNSIFEKIKLDYNKIRKLEHPAKPFIEYYKKFAKPGEEPWWLGSEQETNTSPMLIRLFSYLEAEEKGKLITDSIILFPEILTKHREKYKRVAIWLANRHGVVSPSLRDEFTAGGQQDIEIDGKVYKSKSKIFATLQKYKENVFKRIKTISKNDLKYYWKSFDEKKTVQKQWIELCIDNCEPKDRDFIGNLLLQ
jgi:hypothetical protein